MTNTTELLAGAVCLGCGCEPEIDRLVTRGDVVVGYVCTCSTVVVDGVATGSIPNR
ncbi:hypothetical protein [Amycolatopsis magusensis]|uniref:hypothetical protein n=1 Tax=Amycolatopsis magusensis TaxID=882444 RepID=UPI0037990D41